MGGYEYIGLQSQDGVATLTLNRPDKRNAISDAMRAELIHALEAVAQDRAVRALVLTGACGLLTLMVILKTTAYLSHHPM